MAKKEWCNVCKNFATAKDRWQGGSIRTCKFNEKQVTTDKKMSQCDGFQLYPYVWCHANKGRFSVEICRIASKEECAYCETGELVREVLPSKPLTFQPGDVHGLCFALRKMRERLELEEVSVPENGNGAKPVKFLRRRVPVVTKTQSIPQPPKKKRKPILIRTPKE